MTSRPFSGHKISLTDESVAAIAPRLRDADLAMVSEACHTLCLENAASLYVRKQQFKDQCELEAIGMVLEMIQEGADFEDFEVRQGAGFEVRLGETYEVETFW